MSKARTDWYAVFSTLGITTETCTVYRAQPKKHSKQKRRLTKETAIKDALTEVANSILPACDCERGDHESPSHYCGCTHRTLEVVEVLTDIAKRLPVSMDEWKLKTTWKHWENYQWKE